MENPLQYLEYPILPNYHQAFLMGQKIKSKNRVEISQSVPLLSLQLGTPLEQPKKLVMLEIVCRTVLQAQVRQTILL
jgi:hypothetical protein